MNILEIEQNDLELIVGDYLSSAYLGARPEDDNSKKATGSRWLNRPPRKIQLAVCQSPAIKLIRSQSEKDLVMLLAVIYAAIQATGFFSLDSSGEKAAFAASAYWCHKGLEWFCGD